MYYWEGTILNLVVWSVSHLFATREWLQVFVLARKVT